MAFGLKPDGTLDWRVAAAAAAVVLCCCCSSSSLCGAVYMATRGQGGPKAAAALLAPAKLPPPPVTAAAATQAHAPWPAVLPPSAAPPLDANSDPGAASAYPDYPPSALLAASTGGGAQPLLPVDGAAPRACVIPRDWPISLEPLTHPNHSPDENLVLDGDREPRAFLLETQLCREPGALAVRDVGSGRYLTNVGRTRVRMAGFSDPHSCWKTVNLTCPGSDYTNLLSVSEPERFLEHRQRKLRLGANPDGPQYCWRK